MGTMIQIALIKILRCVKRIPRVAVTRFLEPIFSTGQILTFAVSVIGLMIILQSATPQERDMQAEQWAVAIEAFGYALLGWAVISTICAPFIVIRNDRQNGKWDAHRFIYHNRVLVLTKRVEANGGDTTIIPVFFPDPEPNSVVSFVVEATPPANERIRFLFFGGVPKREINIGPLLPKLFDGTARPGAHCGIRLSPERRATLYVRLEPETVSIVLRIFCHSFYVGKDEDEFA